MSALLSVQHVLQVTRGLLVRGDLEQRRVSGCAIDSRAIGPDGLFFALPGRNTDGHQFVADAARRGGAGAVVSRPDELRQPLPEGFGLIAVSDVARALYELAAWYRRRLAPRVVAVTGSCGKSTLKELLRAVCHVAGRTAASPGSYNNHLGVPLSILGAPPSTEFLVLEMGMNAPGEIATLTRLAWPDVAVITNVGPAHLERLGSIASVARAKAEIFEGLAPGGLAVLPAGDEHLRGIEESLRAGGRRVRTFGATGDLSLVGLARAPSPVRGGSGAPVEGLALITSDGARWWLPGTSRTAASGALIAIVVARALGIDDVQIAAGLASYQPLPMRQRVLELAGGGLAIDDCYNANPLSVQAALEQLSFEGAGRRKVAVLGEMCELGADSDHWHAQVGRSASRVANEVWGVGPGTRPLVEAVRDEGGRAELVASAEEAAQRAAELMRPGDAVLIKGSRAVGLERVVRAIEDHCARLAARPAVATGAETCCTTS